MGVTPAVTLLPSLLGSSILRVFAHCSCEGLLPSASFGELWWFTKHAIKLAPLTLKASVIRTGYLICNEMILLKGGRPLQLYSLFSVGNLTVLKCPVVSRKSVVNVESIATQYKRL